MVRTLVSQARNMGSTPVGAAHMKFLPLGVFRFKTTLVISIFSAAILLFVLGLIYFSRLQLEPPLILHFDSWRGIDFYGGISNLWGIWLVVFFFNLLNFVLAKFFFFRERFVFYLFISVNLILNILLLIIVGTILSVN